MQTPFNELCRFSDSSDGDNARDCFFLVLLFSRSVSFVIGLLLGVCKTNTNATAEI